MYFIDQKCLIINQIQKVMQQQMNDNGHNVDHIDHKRTPIIAETAAPSQRYPPFRLMLNLAYHGTHNYYLILHALNCLFVQVLVYSCNQYRENGILQINSGGTNL